MCIRDEQISKLRVRGLSESAVTDPQNSSVRSSNTRRGPRTVRIRSETVVADTVRGPGNNYGFSDSFLLSRVSARESRSKNLTILGMHQRHDQ